MKPSTRYRPVSVPVGEQAARPLPERLAAHPRLRQRIEQILDIVECDSQTDCTADEAERHVRDQTRALAHEVLQHWAEAAVTSATQRARQQHPQAIVNAKKSSLAHHLWPDLRDRATTAAPPPRRAAATVLRAGAGAHARRLHAVAAGAD